MRKPTPYKVQDVHRNARKGIVARSLAELTKKGIEKLRFPQKGCRVCTEDGTEVDDEEYFETLPAQSVFVFVKPDEEWEGYVTVLKNATEKVFKAMSQRDKIVEKINNFIGDGDSEQIYCIMAEVVNRLTENIDAEEREEDEDWFDGVGEKYKTKSEVLRNSAQSRIRSYLYKTKDAVDPIKASSNTRTKKSSKPLLLEVLENFKDKLKEEEYFGDYFVRNGDESIRLCCEKGWFECQGEYNVEQCTKRHKINPYGSKESRILFSTWNLDHVIEKSRQVLPTMLSAADNCPKSYQLNTDYFFELLFTLDNLKLVHIGCHDKSEHHGKKCNKKLFYKKL